jgi:hypothetical protein
MGGMERSRKLVLTDWTKANDALNQYFKGNKSKLTEYVKNYSHRFFQSEACT